MKQFYLGIKAINKDQLNNPNTSYALRIYLPSCKMFLPDLNTWTSKGCKVTSKCTRSRRITQTFASRKPLELISNLGVDNFELVRVHMGEYFSQIVKRRWLGVDFQLFLVFLRACAFVTESRRNLSTQNRRISLFV